MKSKLKFILPLALVIFGGTYKFVLAKPAPLPKPKVAGEVYVLPKDFLLNLKDGKFVKLGVGLVFKAGYVAAPAGGGEAPPAAPEGYGVLTQEAVVRDIITDVVSGSTSAQLVTSAGRKKIKKRILHRLETSTDVKVADVLLTDVAVDQ